MPHWVRDPVTVMGERKVGSRRPCRAWARRPATLGDSDETRAGVMICPLSVVQAFGCGRRHRRFARGAAEVATADRRSGLDHTVVLMFENRSFDNLLGRLYQPGEVASFEGVIGKELSNPIPEWAEHGADRTASCRTGWRPT